MTSANSQSAEPTASLRVRILDVAARLVDERGYRGTPTTDIARAAGVSIGSLYQCFPNKDALLAGLTERHLRDVLPDLRELRDSLDRDQPDVDETARRIVGCSIEINSRPLHRLLQDAPRTDAIKTQVSTFEEAAALALAAHLIRFGNAPEAVNRRTRLLMVMVDAAIHDPAIDDVGAVDDLTVLVARMLTP